MKTRGSGVPLPLAVSFLRPSKPGVAGSSPAGRARILWDLTREIASLTLGQVPSEPVAARQNPREWARGYGDPSRSRGSGAWVDQL